MIILRLRHKLTRRSCNKITKCEKRGVEGKGREHREHRGVESVAQDRLMGFQLWRLPRAIAGSYLWKM